MRAISSKGAIVSAPPSIASPIVAQMERKQSQLPESQLVRGAFSTSASEYIRGTTSPADSRRPGISSDMMRLEEWPASDRRQPTGAAL